jgi:hypothetical protein
MRSSPTESNKNKKQQQRNKPRSPGKGASFLSMSSVFATLSRFSTNVWWMDSQMNEWMIRWTDGGWIEKELILM